MDIDDVIIYKGMNKLRFMIRMCELIIMINKICDFEV